MGQQISGQDFDTMIGDLLIHVESMTATISDNSAGVSSGGVPDGYVRGDVTCTGEVEVDNKNFNLIMESAKSAGSFRDLEPFDITVIAKNTNSEHKQELFGCLLKVSDLLNIDQNGGEKVKHKLPFEVTSPDFVRINGVPYLSERDTRNS